MPSKKPEPRRRAAARARPDRRLSGVLGALCCAAAPAAFAQAGAAAGAEPGTARLAPVVVTATRTEARAFDVPASIDRIDGDEVRAARAQVNISETLAGVPGVFARDRQNYAQDVQVSVRGFGARATFGIRGVRLYVDGIPATLPDGQGQISHVELGSTDRIEVLRGPFSALYGNSSGGVIQVFTEEGSGPPRLRFDAATGSHGTLRLGVQAAGESGGLGYVVGASRFRTDGWRDHSEARRMLGNAKLTLRPDVDSTLTLIVNSMDLPLAKDPLGLTRAQYEANPRGVDPAATTFDTRKTVDQTQGGVIYERRLGAADTVRLLAYRGHRGTDQVLAIPVAPQNNPLHPGGFIDLGRDYHGADLRWTHRTRLLQAPLSVVAGVAYDKLDERRRGYQNFVGTQLGVQGALRRDEKNEVSNFDQYVQASWRPATRWTVNAGVRHSAVRFGSKDDYVVAPNPDDSGSRRYDAWLPALGVLYAVNPGLNVYAAAGRGFETPTLNELAYRPGGLTGLNLALDAARSRSVEFGVKARSAALGDLTAAVFRTSTEDEIVTATNTGGRATFRNAGGTRRSGFELGWNRRWAGHLRAQAAYTHLDARYRDGFAGVPAGSRIPGLARSSFHAALAWMPPAGWRAGVEARALGKVYVNDANGDAAAGHAVVAAHIGYALKAGRWDLGGFVRVDNLLDRRHAGSVIVNEGNGRFFESGPGRTWLAGVSATLGF